ncbi:cAMP-dependent protein kinase catalytic subunit-like [Drosophila sulfurigaster albostrigata]|uniref:cAMP-dependent protein kinase catalytic subunit-like n=1 Tax=Drosophila sulfurigaster albostrigata TaxID=89887 RepID=UPI002D21B080|nr:cAMP-dependent protein kinase catalytic subunit-like [Drosophila sulfurigaster albostrigata]
MLQQQQQQPPSSYQQPQQYQAFPTARQQQYQAWQQPQQQYAPRQQQQHQQQQQQYQYHQPEQHLQLQSYPTQQQLAMQPVFAYDGRGCYTPAGYTLTPVLAATTTTTAAAAASDVSDGQCVYYQYADEDYVNSVNYYDQSTGDMCAMGLVYVAYKDNNSNYDGAQSYALTEQSNRSHRQRGMRQRTLLQVEMAGASANGSATTAIAMRRQN